MNSQLNIFPVILLCHARYPNRCLAREKIWQVPDYRIFRGGWLIFRSLCFFEGCWLPVFGEAIFGFASLEAKPNIVFCI